MYIYMYIYIRRWDMKIYFAAKSISRAKYETLYATSMARDPGGLPFVQAAAPTELPNVPEVVAELYSLSFMLLLKLGEGS